MQITKPQVTEISILEAFKLFQLDYGRVCLAAAKAVRHDDRPEARRLLALARKHMGHDWWYINPRQRRGNVKVQTDINFDSQDPLAIHGSPEREERIARLREYYAKQADGDETSPFNLPEFQTK
jgi:hypothetical protein